MHWLSAMATAPDRAEAASVAVLAKAPVAGRAKTRLASALGAAGAARLHRQLVLIELTNPPNLLN